MKRLIIKSSYNVLGSISVGNGLWMMLSSSSWFKHMPVDAEDTGELNPHFVHDVGLVYLLIGVGAFWCAQKPRQSFEIHMAITLFMSGHALIHMIEILFGYLPASHWLIDFPLITFPALLLISLTPFSIKSKS